jgi:hypothetical protein
MLLHHARRPSRTSPDGRIVLDATQPKGRRYYWKSEYLPALDPARTLFIVAGAAGFLNLSQSGDRPDW